MRHLPRAAALLLLLLLSFSGCASSQPTMITAVQPGRPSLTPAESVQFQCGDPPRLPAGVPSWDDLLGFSLTLRSAYDDCRDTNGRLVDLATRVPGTPYAAPPQEK